MFANYRSKSVFRGIDDIGLKAYVQAMAVTTPDGKVTLAYPPEWEARIYATGVIADRPIWRDLPGLKVPVLFIRGANTDTFWEETARLVQRRLPTARIVTLQDSSHLVPLEKPDLVFQTIQEFIRPNGSEQSGW
jgi:pimeloyl-ACP methyl ester carboxylesterase